MSRDRKVLERHFQHWRAHGLLDEEHEARLRQASETLDRGHTSTVVRAAVALLGGGLVLAGVILIVAENWGAIPHLVKLGAWAVLQCGFLFLAHDLNRRFPDRSYLSEAFALVSGGWVLGGIALVSQIYHLDSRPPNGIWLWLALVLPAAWALRTRATAFVLFVALTAALSLEVNTAGSWLHAAHAESPWLALAIPTLGAALVSFLPTPPAFLRTWAGAWLFLALSFWLLVFGASHYLDHTALGWAWSLVVPAIAFAALAPERCLPANWDRSLSLALLASVAPWVLIGAEYDGTHLIDNVAVGLSWILQLGLAALVIRAGARAGSPAWINLGYVALVVGILTRYFDFFGAYLEGGLALTATGALLLFVLYALERARRRTLAQGVSA